MVKGTDVCSLSRLEQKVSYIIESLVFKVFGKLFRLNWASLAISLNWIFWLIVEKNQRFNLFDSAQLSRYHRSAFNQSEFSDCSIILAALAVNSVVKREK